MSLKKKVIYLLNNGYSYSQIRKKLGVSKSTINHWFKQLSEKEKRKIRIFRIKNWKNSYKNYAKIKKEKTIEKERRIQNKAAQKVDSISRKELLLIGIALYWAEGYKGNRWGLQFSNSDSQMISLMMRFFREICRVKEEKFYMQMILHRNINEKKALNYWSKITRIPEDQFKKACFSLSKSSKGLRKKHQLPYGTLQIRIHDKRLTHQVYGYIKGLKQAGVVQE